MSNRKLKTGPDSRRVIRVGNFNLRLVNSQVMVDIVGKEDVRRR